MRRSKLSPAERRLWDAFPRGDKVDLGPGDPTAEDFDPGTWGEDRCVRGEVITRLLLGALEREPGYVARIVLAGARIIGAIDLSGGQTDYELLLHRCWLDEPIDFTNTSSKSVVLRRVHLPGLYGVGWQASGMVLFADSRCEGEIILVGAHVSGQLNFQGTKLSNPDGHALSADGLTVDGDMFCREGFTANGEVRLLGSHIGGSLDFFGGATLRNPDGCALNADGLTVNGDMFCREGFTAEGEIRLLGARIGSDLGFSVAKLSNPKHYALSADRLTLNGSMYCSDGFTTEGEIRLLGAHIGGSLNFGGAKLSNPNQHALNADRLTLNGSMYCDDGFAAEGEIRLVGAHIGSKLDFEGAHLSNKGNVALLATRLTVEGSIFCIKGFRAEGEIRLRSARVTSQLNFSSATLRNPGDTALDLYRLECSHVTVPSSTDGYIDLRAARVGTLQLPEAEQPQTRLAGLTYTDLDPDPDPPVRERIAWLRRDPNGFHSQPYEQLAAYYRSIGHDRDARRVLLARHRTRRHHIPHTWRLPRGLTKLRPLLAFVWRIPGWLYDGLSGYGYVPWRTFIWFLAAIAAGALTLHDPASTTPTQNTYVNAVLLALDATLPTSPFGIREKADLTGGDYLMALALQGIGYVLTLALIPTLARSLNRTAPANQ